MHAIDRERGVWLRAVPLLTIGLGWLTIKVGGMSLSVDAWAALLAVAIAIASFAWWRLSRHPR